jgi:hypothetical protein
MLLAEQAELIEGLEDTIVFITHQNEQVKTLLSLLFPVVSH